MNYQDLENHYNKFNEEKRLLRKHAQPEYLTTMKYIHQFLKPEDTILEIGAGTGRYSVALANEGYDVTAIELTKTNLGRLKAKKSTVKAYQGNALDLSRFKDHSFDVTLLLGPMYHLNSEEERLQALKEAKRVTKTNGVIFVAYLMNDYSVIRYGFMEGNIQAVKEQLDSEFNINNENELYSRIRIEQIDALNQKAECTRIKIIAADGPAEYLRSTINKMDEETFNLFMQYHLATCERSDLLGASAHLLDIIKNEG